MQHDVRPTLFAGIDIARRIERAEQSLIEEAARATEPLGSNAPPRSLPIAGGRAVWAATDSPFNKVVGAGIDGHLDENELLAVEAMFDRRGAPVQFEISTLADPSVAEQLTRRGYVLVGFENVFGLPLDLDVARAGATGIDVRRIDLGDADDHRIWLDVDVEASSTPDTAGIASHEDFARDTVERAMCAMASTNGFVAAVASIDGVPAGSGSLRLCDGVAQLCGASTLPAFRRRGVQSSLLSERLAWASASGCDLAVVTVQPGSTSQQNVQRIGFQLLYARSILVRQLG